MCVCFDSILSHVLHVFVNLILNLLRTAVTALAESCMSCSPDRSLVISYLKCAAYKSTYLLTYLLTLHCMFSCLIL